MAFKHYQQHDIMDCGPTCLKMVAKYYGKTISIERLRENSEMNKNGVSLYSISKAAEKLGFITSGAIVSYKQLKDEVSLPCIIHWTQNHFVVLYKITKNKVYLADPAQGKKVYSKIEFVQNWSTIEDDNHNGGVVLLLEPSPEFYNLENEREDSLEGLKLLLQYFRKYRKELYYVMIAIFISSIFQFIFPFLTQAIVDKGIGSKSYSIVLIILVSQFILLFGRFLIEYIRSWFLLFINSRINVSILSDYLIKLMKLPVSYFDTKRTGDILQRMSDHQKIQDFLTGPALELIFSTVTVFVLGSTLIFYSLPIFILFSISSILYVLWTVYMLKFNATLNYKRFELGAMNQTQTLQIINGIQDIKLFNSQNIKRWKWERIQAKLFKLSIRYLKYNQVQQSGSFILNESKNLLITYIAATSVIRGDFTLGMMLAIQAIVGQLNGPISLLINLIRQWDDTKLSLDRLNEVRKMKDEESQVLNSKSFLTSHTISCNNLNFSYPGSTDYSLREVNLTIDAGKTTAIVGPSGSGKTTLLKLLLKFYNSYDGELKVGEDRLTTISSEYWRSLCGTVMQDSFIFSDTIAHNIALGEERIDYKKLDNAIHNSNIKDFIDELPLGYNTLIGAEGIGVSQGQKQRILIARAIYKNPEFIFFDEATNALDASNEAVIVNNLERFFANRTVVVVAHRLSTVKHANKIVVLDKGRVVEVGTHNELILKQGAYFNLVKNQLELSE